MEGGGMNGSEKMKLSKHTFTDDSQEVRMQNFNFLIGQLAGEIWEKQPFFKVKEDDISYISSLN